MIGASIQYTDHFIIEALCHYRLQHKTRRLVIILKSIMTLCLGAIAVGAFIEGPVALGLLFIGFILLLLFGHYIDYWLARRSLRKWAFRGEKVVIDFTDEGFHAKSLQQETTLRWSSFTRIVHFRDGFMLFHGPASFHWIPASALVGSSEIAELEKLLRSKVIDHRVVEQVVPTPNQSR